MRKKSLIVFASLLSGCSFVDEPLPLYILKNDCIEQKAVLLTPLAIELPGSEPSLNSPRIAITCGSYQREYAANGQWTDKLPKVVQNLIIDNLNQRWGGKSVHRMNSGLQTTYLLKSEIQDFSIHTLPGEKEEVRLEMVFQLINLRERQVVEAKTFSETLCTKSLSMSESVKAFNKGFHDIIEKVAQWLEPTLLKKGSQNARYYKLRGEGRQDDSKNPGDNV